MESKRSIYLDNAAGTPIDKEVFQKMLPYFGDEYANPSSVYKSGRKSAKAIQIARKGIAEIIDARVEEIIFTSSGTESDNLAILGVARANKKYGNHILISSIEHKAVLESAKQLEKEGFNIEYIPVDKYGMINVDDCMKLVTEKTILISVMYANNEIGTIQPIQELGRRIQESRKQKVESRGGNSRSEFPDAIDHRPSTISYPIFHTDACQAAGQLPLNVNDLGVDLMTLNGSKIYGPKGIGVLYKKSEVNIEPIIFGGGQENNLRSGTECLPLIVGMYEALKLAEKKREQESLRLIVLRGNLLQKLQESISGVVVNGHFTKRLPNNIHISIPNIEGESIVLMLDEKGIQVSTGSACSSKDLEVSYVLKAIKQDERLMHGSIRVSLGRETKKEDIDYFIFALLDVVNCLKSISSLTINI